MSIKKLIFVLVLSIFTLPAVTSARLLNETISHKGSLNILGATSIRLQEYAGDSIELNKGVLDIKTTKISKGFSLLAPQLILTQNDQKLIIDIKNENYSGEENFTILGKDTGLNYDLYLRKTSSTQKVTDIAKTIICTYKVIGVKCGMGMGGKHICVPGRVDKKGTQDAKRIFQNTQDIYKLTFGEDNIAKAEFTSVKERSELVTTEELSSCK